jgi:hypothetical protein
MRILKSVLPLIAHAVTIFYGINTVRKLENEYRNAQLLREQMETDHATLVKKVIAVNDAAFRLKDDHDEWGFKQDPTNDWLDRARKAAEGTENIDHPFMSYLWSPSICGYVEGDSDQGWMCGYSKEEHRR